MDAQQPHAEITALLGRGTRFEGKLHFEGRVRIGNGCRIMSHCYICSRTTIGDYVFVGPGCTFLNERYPMRHEKGQLGPTIESYACVGGGVTLGPGITVGEASFVTSWEAPAEFGLEGAEKALYNRVVPAVARPAHALS